MKKFFSLLILLVVNVSLHANQGSLSPLQAQAKCAKPNAKAKDKVKDKRNCHKNSHHCSSRCHTHPQCPKKFTLPNVILADTPVEPKGSMVYNLIDENIYFSDGTKWIAVEDESPLPLTIIVDPLLPPNGKTVFNTIQGAIDSLGDQPIFDTTIQIAKGTYAENLVLQSILNSDFSKLKIQGDLRNIAGCGIAHDSFWNIQAVTGPVGGGNNSKAVLSTGINTLTVTASAGTNPDFVAAMVVPGDQVVIRDNAGGFNFYTVAVVAPQTLTFTTNIVAPANALGAAMCVVPNVAIQPAAGTVINQAAYATFLGLFLNVPTGQVGLNAISESITFVTNSLIYGGNFGIVASGAQVQSPTRFGFSVFNSNTVGVQSLLSVMQPQGLLVALAPNKQAINVNAHSLFAVTGGVKAIGSMLCASDSHFANPIGSLLDVIVSGGTAFSCGGSNFEQRGSITLRGAPTIGLSMSSSRLDSSGSSVLSLQSTAANFIGLQMGTGVGDASVATLNFGTLVIPATSTSYIAQVQDGSLLAVRGLPLAANATIGANSQGFLAKNGSTIEWVATGTTGSITGNAATTLASGARLFDIQDSSSLIFYAGANRTFTNYPIIYNFDNNSRGELNNVTSTTTAGGTNLTAANMSRVEIDTVTFNASGANTGITASFGAFVGKKGGAMFTNSAATPISSCSLATNAPSNSNTCSFNDGLVSVSP